MLNEKKTFYICRLVAKKTCLFVYKTVSILVYKLRKIFLAFKILKVTVKGRTLHLTSRKVLKERHLSPS